MPSPVKSPAAIDTGLAVVSERNRSAVGPNPP